MRVRVRLFASLAQAAGSREHQMDVPEGSTAGDVLALLKKGPLLSLVGVRVLFAVNRVHCSAAQTLGEGDEVALFPPVSGGSGAREELLVITADPLDARRLSESVRASSCGAVVTFEGIVRDHGEAGPVVAIDYEAHPEMAREVLRQIRDEVEARHPGCRLAMAHRVGRLLVGEPSVAVACAAPHRREAFAACRLAMDRIKESLPAWKAEEAPSGARKWR